MMTATQTKSDQTTLEVRRTVNTTAERAFKAWTDPNVIPKWFGGGKLGKFQYTHDFRVGGNYSLTSESCSNANEMVTVSGTFQEIVPNRKLVYTWSHTSTEFPAKDTLVTVEFIEKGSSTEIVLKHTKFTAPQSVERHTMGWGACLDGFAAMFE